MCLEEGLISVVVPVYNAEKWITDTIQCLLGQTYEKLEIILVDDCSTDRSRSIIEAIPDERIRVFRNERNRGPAYTRNHGIREASGRYLAYLDADDLCDKDKLEKQLLFMKKTGCAFCFHGYEFADATGRRNGRIVHVPEKITYEEALKNTTISTITVMFDRKQIPDEILFMPLDARGEDTATWWKILRHGYVAYGIDEPLSVYRRTAGTRSSNKLDAVYGTWKMYRRNEGLGFFRSIHCFLGYIVNAVKRRRKK